MADRSKFKWKKCKGEVTPERVHYVQSQLSIKFPESYLQIIKECDGGIPVHTDFDYFDEYFKSTVGTGIGSFLPLNPSSYGDVLEENLLSPPEFFPEDLIAFAEVGNGDLICFDYRQGKDNPDPSVVYWSHGADIGKNISFVAKNFEAFLEILKKSEY